MARYHGIESSFWEDFQEKSSDEKVLYLYAISNPSTRDSGLYQVSLQTILLNTGFTEEKFREVLKKLEGKLYYDFDNRLMFVNGKLKHRLSGLKNNVNTLRAVMHDLQVFKNSPLISLFTKRYKETLMDLQGVSLSLETNKGEKKQTVGTTVKELLKKYRMKEA